jgi:cystathionine beta-lyase
MKYNFDKIIKREGTLSIKWDAKKMFNIDDQAIPLWVADTDFCTVKEVNNAIKKRAKHPIYGYSFVDDCFYNSIIDWYRRRKDFLIEKDDIIFIPGVVTGLHISILALTKPGDSIIVQTPVYYPFMNAVTYTGRNLLINELKYEGGRYLIDFENLEKLMLEKPKMILFCSPHNPVGRVWGKDELNRLLELCLENNVYLVSDEIHGDLIISDKKHICISTISKDIKRLLITLSAPSKTFNIAGFSTSYAIIEDEAIRERFNRQILAQNANIYNIFGLIALEKAYRYGDEYLKQLLKYLSENFSFLLDRFKGMPKIKVVKCEGTYLAWFDCRNLGLADDMLSDFFENEAKLWLSEGKIYGRGGEGFMRLNFGTSRKILSYALDRLQVAYDKRFK